MTAPSLAAGNKTPAGVTKTTDLWFEALQFASNSFEISPMNTLWGNYCGDFSYSVVYDSGDLTKG